MASGIRTFTNVRARLYRYRDDAWLAGWVTHLARDQARIRLCVFSAMTPNEKVVGECYGLGTVARFHGRVTAQAGQEMAIEIVGSISYGPSDETPRIEASGLMGSLDAGERTSTMQVLDVSPESLGALVDCGFTPGSELTMTLPTDVGPIHGKVSVANCRLDGDNEDHYRIGLYIVSMDRLDRARWSRLVNERAAA